MDTLRSTRTHEVLNQASPLEGRNFFQLDLPLQEALEREGGGWALDRARDTGAVAGSAEAQEHGRRAERNASSFPFLRSRLLQAGRRLLGSGDQFVSLCHLIRGQVIEYAGACGNLRHRGQGVGPWHVVAATAIVLGLLLWRYPSRLVLNEVGFVLTTHSRERRRTRPATIAVLIRARRINQQNDWNRAFWNYF